ncbi:MAG: PBSX family phage terminase large subunit, partial [Clostridiales bacterium]|nr:PBSX family phage terminase large subunit [Clostridiales bacterium]
MEEVIISKEENKSHSKLRDSKKLKEYAEQILSLPVSEDNRDKLLDMGIDLKNMDNKMLMVAAVYTEAAKGNINAIKEIRSLIGENIDGADSGEYLLYSGIPAKSIGRAFVDIHRDILNRGHRFFDFKGGRGSLKSSFCALTLIDEIERNPNFCAVALRQVMETLRDSVYAQLVWAIEELGLSGKYKCTVSPMQIKRVETGQIIYFRGGDDPLKLKSLRPPKGMHIGIVWFEEKDQFKGEEAIRNILQSLMRGGENIIVLSSYNTPLSKRHFLNEDILEDRENRIIHHSFYYDSPREWLGQPFFDEAEHLKKVNEKAYSHEYLGEATGTGGNVFENITVREIEDTEIKDFDRLYFGLDWGWYPDPTAFIKCYYNAEKRSLYILDEFGVHKMNNEKIAGILAEKGVGPEDMLICDTNDKKSIADLNAFGFYARPAEKGANSVNYGIKWLQGLTEIVIDPKRTPLALKEFVHYEYDRDL